RPRNIGRNRGRERERRRGRKSRVGHPFRDHCYNRVNRPCGRLIFCVSACHVLTAVLEWIRSDKNDMIELVQFPWSPFCLVQRRILEYSGTPFKIVNVPPQDRSLVWKLTRQRYYGVPIIMDGRTDVFEVDEDSQVIGNYLDSKFS